MKRWIMVALIMLFGMNVQAQTPSNFEVTPTALDAVLARATLDAVGALDSAFVAHMPDTSWVATFVDSLVLEKEISGLPADRYFDWAVVAVDTLGFKRVSNWVRFSTGSNETPDYTVETTSTAITLTFTPARIAHDSLWVVTASDSSLVMRTTDTSPDGYTLTYDGRAPGETVTWKIVSYGAGTAVYSASITITTDMPQIEPVIADEEWRNDIVARLLYRADAWAPGAIGTRQRNELASIITGAASLPDTIPLAGEAAADSSWALRLLPVTGHLGIAAGDSVSFIIIFKELSITPSGAWAAAPRDTLTVESPGYFSWNPRHNLARYGYFVYEGATGNGSDGTYVHDQWILRSRR